MFNTGLLNARDIGIILVVSIGGLVFLKWAVTTAGINLPEL